MTGPFAEPRSIWLILFLCLVAPLGCGKSPSSRPSDSSAVKEPVPAADDEPTQVAADADAATNAPVPAPAPDTASDTAPNAADEADPDGKLPPSAGVEPTADVPGAAAESAAASVNSAASQAGELPRERFLLLAPGGPMVIDLAVTIDGLSLDQPLDQLIEQALTAADSNGDGMPTWEEILQSSAFQSGRFGNLPFETDDQRRQLQQMYDRNEDGIVDRDELPRFVTRNAGGAKSFSLRSSNVYRSSNRSRSPVRLLLDADHDGSITTDEMAAAPQRLRMRDANDDRVLAPSDFSAESMLEPGVMRTRTRINEPDTAVLLGAEPNWGDVAFRLEESYAFVGEGLKAGDWPLAKELFQQLDANQDESLSGTELRALADVAADMLVRVRFGTSPPATTEAAPAPPLELLEIAPAWEARASAIRRNPRRLSLELPNLEVEFFLNEDPALSDPRRAAEALFGVYDLDGNEYLDEAEFPEPRLPGLDVDFAEADADGDGQVVLDELALAIALRLRATAAQVRARVADQPDALFTALDQDGDGRLTDRELAATPARLEQLDRNRDGQLQSHEIPGSMVVAIIRGNPNQDDNLLAGPAIAEATDGGNVPRWFAGMDANGDGEIARREFLGPPERFAELDRDGDGFLMLEEVQRVEAASR